jgi:hypothetical protein
VVDGNLVTKCVVGDAQAELQDVRADVAALRIQLRGDSEARKADTLTWMFGTVELETIVILGPVIPLARTLH